MSARAQSSRQRFPRQSRILFRRRTASSRRESWRVRQVYYDATREKMSHKTRIVYREFYDVPRMLILTHRGQKLLLDCKFDESLDEYPAVYKVYALPLEIDENALQSWDALPQNAMKYLGDIPVEKVMFDPS